MRVDVIMEVAPVTGEPSAGMQYILLIDAVTDESIDQVEVQADGSSTPYQFDLVPAGEYIVLSGTDLNNDGFICDPAEACGAYPVESSPVRIVVGDGSRRRTGLPGRISHRSTELLELEEHIERRAAGDAATTDHPLSEH